MVSRTPGGGRGTRRGAAPCAAAVLLGATLSVSGLAAQTGDAFAPFHHDPARPEVLRLDGPIDVRTPFMLSAALRAHPDAVTLELHSPGGDIYQALNMIETIRAAGLATSIAPDDRCHSACAFLFFAGAERTAEGALGVHQLAAPNQQSAQYVMNDVLDALLHLDVPDEVRRRMFQTPADEMYVFSPQELVALGISTPDAGTADKVETPDQAPQIIVRVRPDGRGDHATIAEAVRAVAPRTRILVYPGTYTGHVTVREPVEIVGFGDRDDIVWEATWSSILRWEASGGTLTGLTLRHATSGPLTRREGAVLEIRAGAPTIDDVAILAPPDALAAIRVSGSAAPVIAGSHVSGGRTGVLLDGAGGTLRDTLVTRSEVGIAIRTGAPLVKANRILNVGAGVVAEGTAAGEVARNEVRYCARGIVTSGAATTVTEANAVESCEIPRLHK